MGFDEGYVISTFERLVNIDSTTGFCRDIENEVSRICQELGYKVIPTHKGGIMVDAEGEGNTLVVTAHLDTLGLMVRHIYSDGSLKVCPIGGLYPAYCVGENVRIYTRDGKTYTGVLCRHPNSIHVSEDEIRKNPGDFEKDVRIILDEDSDNDMTTRSLGIEVGDIVSLYPRTEYRNGYLKSRFVDDKAAVAVCLNALKTMKEKNIAPKRHVLFYFSSYEEIGHGTSYLPSEVKDILAVDIAPLGDEQTSNERKVSIFCKDSRFPYHYEFASYLREIAKSKGVDFVMDVFTPHYGSDGDTSLVAGHDVRHACIGFGTLNSHGYERTHIKGLEQTYDLLMGVLLD